MLIAVMKHDQCLQGVVGLLVRPQSVLALKVFDESGQGRESLIYRRTLTLDVPTPDRSRIRYGATPRIHC